MARKKRETESIKNKVEKISDNLKSGNFKRDELILYRLKNTEIDTILEYQKILPILSDETKSWIEGRILHSQLQVGKDFTNWMKDRINKYGFIEEEDFEVDWYSKGVKFDDAKSGDVDKNNTNQMIRKGYLKEYKLTIEMAKQLAMVQNNDIGKIARKYFIYIEKAFKNRLSWNKDRQATLDKYKAMNRAIYKTGDKLINMPDYCYTKQMGENCLLNEVIIGMSAKKYRSLNGISTSTPIRNTFSERQLELYHLLEQYDADLMEVQGEYDYEERRKFLTKKLNIELGYHS